ncbi:MAG: chromate transporter [Candidatus Cloacimonetes bacterium]|nr:chromate transporter [Candidatus Cloacimonadota bacterium]
MKEKKSRTFKKPDSSKIELCLELFIIFVKVGCITFGGGYAMIPFIYRELVINKKWFNNEELVDILTVSQAIPGAIAVNAAFNAGYRKVGVIGGFISALGLVLPAFLAILFIMIFFLNIRDIEWVQKFLSGIIIASTALILSTTINLAKTVYKRRLIINMVISLIVFIGIGYFNINASWMILGGIIFGFINFFTRSLKEEADTNTEE